MQLKPDFQFSQQNMQDFVDCPRRFYLRYVLQMRYPAPISEPVLEQEKRVEQGERFHRLVHQHLLGIPVESLSRLAGDADLLEWWENYLAYQPTRDLPEQRYPEYTLWMRFNGYQMIAKYDLLAVGSGKAYIYDWKTTGRRPGQMSLAQRMQTRVYPFLLVQAGNRLNGGKPFEPAQVQMTYWFPEFPQKPAVFQYSDEQYYQDKSILESLVGDILQRENEESFPQTLDERRCRYCNYRSLCERGKEAGSLADLDDEDLGQEEPLDIDFDTIEEIEF